ncbi:Cilia-and flagella-associated protein 54 [Nibea albiflora]|uniref:Cilia-and flagella-associated protein 54 n=1 Tax=Nibea albiflora TaxID=240163 RepID=A0ACB7F358_NIBAL|nr:Cilia-and flagella-associated protein 54 [Nibea albiflora]
MDMPASYYGELDKRNPVIISIERDMSSFMTLMRRVGCSDHSSYVKGIQILVEIRKKYKHRLPSKLYEERMLQIADFLFGIKLYQLALWQGYSLHLLQFNSVKITDITDVDHFMACFFPEGFDTDQDIFAMKALEYLLWASISVELSIPLITAKYLPWIVTLYCAVCHCYYDNHADLQAEEFARRALSKINDLAKMEEQSDVPTTRESQRAYREASIKAGDSSH